MRRRQKPPVRRIIVLYRAGRGEGQEAGRGCSEIQRCAHKQSGRASSRRGFDGLQCSKSTQSKISPDVLSSLAEANDFFPTSGRRKFRTLPTPVESIRIVRTSEHINAAVLPTGVSQQFRANTGCPGRGLQLMRANRAVGHQAKCQRTRRSCTWSVFIKRAWVPAFRMSLRSEPAHVPSFEVLAMHSE